MNTNRIINTDPLEDIDNDDDMLFTNAFVSRVPKNDISHVQKQNFRRYYEEKRKQQQTTNAVATASSTAAARGDIIEKIKKNTIKTEKVSIISIDSSNRNKYKHPYQNDFILDFRKSFYNVKTIKLLSTSIPNTDQVIKDIPEEIRTDKISWQNLEDLYLGIYDSSLVETVVADTVDLNVVDHGLSTQEYIEPLTVWISNSTCTPSIDGEWIVEVVDSRTLRIALEGGLTVDGTAQIDTGFPTYTVYMTPGNYNINTLSVEMQRVMNLTKRRKGTGDYHFFTVDISRDTDVVTIRSYITTPLELDPISTELNSSDILVTAEQHGFVDGDFVLMTGVTSTGGISSSVLNGLFTVKEATRSTFKYEVNQKATFSIDGGGNGIKTGKPAEFRFLFDTARTKLVEHIGYPDEDSGMYMNTTTEEPLSISVKQATSVQLVTDYFIEFTSNSHGLEEATVFQINSISTGQKPTVFLDSPHGLSGAKNVFVYYIHSNPKLNGFYNITINGTSEFYLNDVTVISPGVGTGQMKAGGDNIRLLNFKSIPIITEREFPVEQVTTNTFRIEVHEGMRSIQEDSIADTVVQTNNLYIEHPLHGFNELTNIEVLPFLQASWDLSNDIDDGATMYSITRGDSKFVSVGRLGSSPPYYRIRTSTDGYTWITSYSSGRNTQGQLNSVCYSPSVTALGTPLYVAVGENNPSNNLVLISEDAAQDISLMNPATWTEVNISFGGIWESVCWSPELQLFVACGYVSDTQRIMTSPDGSNWTLRTTPLSIYIGSGYVLTSITWSPELAIFVAVGEEKTIISSDGINWFHSVNWPDDFWESVVWSPEKEIFVAVCSQLSATVENQYAMISSDGYNWTQSFTPVGSYFRSVAWSPELGIFLAVGSGDDITESNADSMMTSRDGIVWLRRSFSPARYMREVCWASDLDIFVSTAVDFDASPDEFNFLISNISYTDIKCTTLVPHTFTGTRFNDEDLDVYTAIPDNADIDIFNHELQTNNKIIVTDSTTSPNIDGTYFIEVVDAGTIRIPVTLITPGTCKIRHGDSIIFTGTNSVPSIDGMELTVIGYDVNDPTYLEISTGLSLVTQGYTGIIGRKNMMSLHRVTSSEPFGDNFAGIPLELINDTYHKIHKIIDENNYVVKLNKYALYSYSGGGSGITVSSERHGSRVFQSNTFNFEETGKLFKSINLDGEHYIFLISPNLQTVESPGNEDIGEIFAKILLVDVPGTVLYDSFISAPKIFNPPLSVLNQIKLTMKRKDGYLFDLINTDYSLSLEITEIVDQIHQTGISGRTGTSDIYEKIYAISNQ